MATLIIVLIRLFLVWQEWAASDEKGHEFTIFDGDSSDGEVNQLLHWLWEEVGEGDGRGDTLPLVYFSLPAEEIVVVFPPRVDYPRICEEEG